MEARVEYSACFLVLVAAYVGEGGDALAAIVLKVQDPILDLLLLRQTTDKVIVLLSNER